MASACCPIISKPVSAASKRRWAMPSSATAAVTLGTRAHAVRRAAGMGYSLSVAAVMMPSVPSLPTIRWRRS